ncbi:hypothetical protein [Candidatus Phyllobacterium onerii]|uniref:hypothetical protein n=1 Tax=Candidatus Phyllobacterium onerii TaxID=3020828 RepID=UPI00232AB3C3|nr:hypothetical protein [Phyllobacterium sp. IY22]
MASLDLDIGTLKSRLVEVEVDNPLYSRAHDGKSANPRKTTARLNVLESAIVSMHNKGKIDDVQYEAAGRFRALGETCGAAGARAIDYSQVRVDGARSGGGTSDRRINAQQQLEDCHKFLDRAVGPDAFKILWEVAVKGNALSELRLPRRATDKAGILVQVSLNKLAEHWCLAPRTNHEHSRHAA